MNDLEVACPLVPFVIAGDEHDRAVFDEQIALSALQVVAVPHAQDLGATRGLTVEHVHLCQ